MAYAIWHMAYGTVLPLKDAVLVRQIGQISEEGNLKYGVCRNLFSLPARSLATCRILSRIADTVPESPTPIGKTCLHLVGTGFREHPEMAGTVEKFIRSIESHGIAVTSMLVSLPIDFGKDSLPRIQPLNSP